MIDIALSAETRSAGENLLNLFPFFTLMNFIVILVVICLLVQFLYWHFIFRRAADALPPTYRAEKEPPFLSVVICFYKPWIKEPEVLQSLAQQTYPHFELVLVNDGPALLDPEIMENHIQGKNYIRYIEHVKTLPGKKGALAAGIQAAAGDWVLLTDIDCCPGLSWLKTMAAFLPAQPAVLLGFSPYTVRPGFLNFVIQQETLLTAFQYLGWARSGHAYMGVGRNMAYHKSIYEEITFDSHCHIPTGDDDLFVNEAARRYPVCICNDRNSFVYSTPALHWKSWYRQKARHKSGGKYYSRASKIRLSIFLLALILEKILLIYLLFTRFDLFLLFAGLKIISTFIPMRTLYRKFDKPSNFWKMHVYEWIHVLYLILVTPYIFFITKQQWD